MSETAFAAIWLILCLCGLYTGWDIHSEYSYEPVGPRTFPLILLSLMAICCVLLLLRKSPAPHPVFPVNLKSLLLLMVTLLLYGWLFDTLGFPFSTTLLAFSVSRLFGASRLAAALCSALMGIMLFYLFDHLLGVTLPSGIWFS